MYRNLIEPAQLAESLDAPDWALLDCRFELTRPDWGVSAYAAGHIPNALYAHLDSDLSGPVSPRTGRHPLPQIASLAETFSRWGIDRTVQVVAYDQGTGAYAARIWWLLRWAGHRQVAVLNGGFAAWRHSGLPVSTAPANRPPRRFVAQPTDASVMTTAELEGVLERGELERGAVTLVDARAADRFAGENETIDPVAGHVPGARNHPFARNLDAQGRFLSAAELRSRWQETLRGQPPGRTVSMCGSGVTACHNLLALEVAGLTGARLYAGSWSEWIRDPARAVAVGRDDASR